MSCSRHSSSLRTPHRRTATSFPSTSPQLAHRQSRSATPAGSHKTHCFVLGRRNFTTLNDEAQSSVARLPPPRFFTQISQNDRRHPCPRHASTSSASTSQTFLKDGENTSSPPMRSPEPTPATSLSSSSPFLTSATLFLHTLLPIRDPITEANFLCSHFCHLIDKSQLLLFERGKIGKGKKKKIDDDGDRSDLGMMDLNQLVIAYDDMVEGIKVAKRKARPVNHKNSPEYDSNISLTSLGLRPPSPPHLRHFFDLLSLPPTSSYSPFTSSLPAPSQRQARLLLQLFDDFSTLFQIPYKSSDFKIVIQTFCRLGRVKAALRVLDILRKDYRNLMFGIDRSDSEGEEERIGWEEIEMIVEASARGGFDTEEVWKTVTDWMKDFGNRQASDSISCDNATSTSSQEHSVSESASLEDSSSSGFFSWFSRKTPGSPSLLSDPSGLDTQHRQRLQPLKGFNGPSRRMWNARLQSANSLEVLSTVLDDLNSFLSEVQKSSSSIQASNNSQSVLQQDQTLMLSTLPNSIAWGTILSKLNGFGASNISEMIMAQLKQFLFGFGADRIETGVRLPEADSGSSVLEERATRLLKSCAEVLESLRVSSTAGYEFQTSSLRQYLQGLWHFLLSQQLEPSETIWRKMTSQGCPPDEITLDIVTRKKWENRKRHLGSKIEVKDLEVWASRIAMGDNLGVKERNYLVAIKELTELGTPWSGSPERISAAMRHLDKALGFSPVGRGETNGVGDGVGVDKPSSRFQRNARLMAIHWITSSLIVCMNPPQTLLPISSLDEPIDILRRLFNATLGELGKPNIPKGRLSISQVHSFLQVLTSEGFEKQVSKVDIRDFFRRLMQEIESRGLDFNLASENVVGQTVVMLMALCKTHERAFNAYRLIYDQDKLWRSDFSHEETSRLDREQYHMILKALFSLQGNETIVERAQYSNTITSPNKVDAQLVPTIYVSDFMNDMRLVHSPPSTQTFAFFIDYYSSFFSRMANSPTSSPSSHRPTSQSNEPDPQEEAKEMVYSLHRMFRIDKECEPDIEINCALIRSYTRVEDFDRAFYVYKETVPMSPTPHVWINTAALYLCGFSKQPQQAQVIMNAFLHGSAPAFLKSNARTMLEAYMHSMCRCGKINLASQAILDFASKSWVKPEEARFIVILMTAYLKGLKHDQLDDSTRELVRTYEIKGKFATPAPELPKPERTSEKTQINPQIDRLHPRRGSNQGLRNHDSIAPKLRNLDGRRQVFQGGSGSDEQIQKGWGKRVRTGERQWDPQWA